MSRGGWSLVGALWVAAPLQIACRSSGAGADGAACVPGGAEVEAPAAAPRSAPLAAPESAAPAAPSETTPERLAPFEARVAELERAFAELEEDPHDPDWLRAKLAHMVEVDQLGRHLVMDLQREGAEPAVRERASARMTEIDQSNTRDLKTLLDLHGWFTIDAFGPEADGNAWLLVQHADRDPDFQRAVLAVLEELVQLGETSPKNFAYLYDRVAVAEGRPQRYGTQGQCVGPGEWEPFPLEDPDRVDEQRASVGLSTLAEYRAVFVDICP